MIDKLKRLKEEYDKISIELSDPELVKDNKLYQEKTKKFSELTPFVEKYDEYTGLQQVVEDSNELLATEDSAEMKEMAQADLDSSTARMLEMKEEIRILLTPKDPNDKKNAIIEIRAGTGGDEAGLFAANLYGIYTRYAERHKLKIEVMSSNETNIGGFKEIIFSVEGPDAYGKLKFESGVHRVQRVPDTETSGRIHTSAVSVAVIAEQEEVDFEMKTEDLRIDTCRASGAGGQHVNKTESAVRIVHNPTGLEVYCQDGRSQLKNKILAMKILRSRVKAKYDSEEKEKQDSDRRAQVGSGDRSEKIRTYNYPQSRVTDHRIGFTSYNLDGVMLGEIDEFVEKLTMEANKKLMESE